MTLTVRKLQSAAKEVRDRENRAGVRMSAAFNNKMLSSSERQRTYYTPARFTRAVVSLTS